MYYISLDLEWNQAYAEQSQAVQKRLGARLRGEVIQIGAVKLDESLQLCGSYSVIVKPRYFKKIHRHVRTLTGITQEMINGGVPLPEAAERFHHWCGEDIAFLTWGPDDIPMLKDNLRIHGEKTEWLDRVYDLQPIFNAQTDGVAKQRSLEFAMETFHIEQNLPAHDALNDAYFTALVATKLDLERGIAEYVQNASCAYLEDIEIGNADAGEQGYDEIGDLLASPKVAQAVCPLCGEPLAVMDRTLHSKGQRYTVLLGCKEHGQMLMNLKLHRNFNETWRARKTLVKATEESVESYRQKLTENEVQRKTRTRRKRRYTSHAANKKVEAGSVAKKD